MRYVPAPMFFMENRPYASDLAILCIGVLVNVESFKFECKPTSIPVTGSKFSAFSNTPPICSVSIEFPVAKEKLKLYSGFLSLLSDMASEKSIV